MAKGPEALPLVAVGASPPPGAACSSRAPSPRPGSFPPLKLHRLLEWWAPALTSRAPTVLLRLLKSGRCPSPAKNPGGWRRPLLEAPASAPCLQGPGTGLGSVWGTLASRYSAGMGAGPHPGPLAPQGCPPPARDAHLFPMEAGGFQVPGTTCRRAPGGCGRVGMWARCLPGFTVDPTALRGLRSGVGTQQVSRGSSTTVGAVPPMPLMWSPISIPTAKATPRGRATDSQG